MTTQTKSPPAAGVVQLPLRRFTVDEYYAMAEAGILKKEERVDLLDGTIVDPEPVLNSRFYSTVTKLNTFLILALGRRAISSVRATVALDEYNAPESDLSLLKEREDFYSSKTPGPADALLVIEVSDSAVDADYDRNEKLPRYARAGVPEIWLTILPERVIEAHTEPAGGRYTQMRTFRPGDTISPGCFPDIALSVDDILPG